MIWLKLDCFKSSSKLETRHSLDTTVKVEDLMAAFKSFGNVKSSHQEQWSMRPIKLRTDILSHPIVFHDRTAGSPKGREP